MNGLARLLRSFAKLRFKLLGMATIKDIPTQRFNEVIVELIANGWVKTYEYSGFDAWIDYGNVRLKKDGSTLNCEWDNWTEGSIEGPERIIAALAENANLQYSCDWRWSEYDQAS